MFSLKAAWFIVAQCFVYFLIAAGKKKERVIPVNNHIAYGGVLSNYVANVHENDTDIQEAAKFAVVYGHQRFPATFPLKDGKIMAFNISKRNKMKLVYTHDDETPWETDFEDPESGDVVRRPLIWGVTTAFSISWPDLPKSYTHQFIVTENPLSGYFVNQHTFQRQTLASGIGGVDLDLSRITVPKPKTNIAIGLESNSGLDFVDKVESNIQEDITVDVDARKKKTEAQKKGANNVKHEQTEANFFSQSMVEKHSEESTGSSSSFCDKDGHCDDINPADKYKAHTQSEDRRCTNAQDSDSCNMSGGVDLRLLTFNLWNFNTVRKDTSTGKYYWKRIRQFANLVLKSGAPVVGFQEVRFDGSRGEKLSGPSQVQHLAQILTDYQFVYRPGQIQKHGLPERIEEGLAIFSKYPILSAKHILLSRDKEDSGDGHQRLLLHAEIELPNQTKIHVLNTHLSLSHIARQRTVRQIWRYMQKLHGPLFLIGDFNAEAHNDEVRFLAGKVSLGGIETHGLVDIWETVHSDDEDGFTFSTLKKGLFRRIDLMFMREDEHVSLLDARLLDDYKRVAEAASDHLGLMGDFHVKSPATHRSHSNSNIPST